MARPRKPVVVYDFETVVSEEETRVWLWGSCDIETERFEYGTDIDSFITTVSKVDSIGYFHNLKFDIQFIFYWLFHNGYSHTSARFPSRKEFTTLISDLGQFYSVEICFENGSKLKLYDSLKLITMPVSAMPKAFGLDIEKLDLDYEAVRDLDHVPTKEEIKYVKHDVLIVARSLRAMKQSGMTKMTAASNALHQFKGFYNKEDFDRMFPQLDLEIDKDCRKSYKGGWTYLNPKYKDIVINDGSVYDVNSMYPWAMSYCELPWGMPIYYTGEYVEDKEFPLFIQCFEAQFKLKPGKFPSIQVKGSMRFIDTEYITETGHDGALLYLTSVDYKLFLDNYDVFWIKHIGGYKFRGAKGIFKDYIDHWYNAKAEYKKAGNMAMYYVAKLMLNSLYGKFGSNPEKRSKYPYLDTEKDIVKYERSLPEIGKTAYVPIASFITSYCRDKIIRTAIACGERFIYADTDSVHIMGYDEPDIDIDDYRLGAFKCESKFTRAKFHRPKCYIEEINGGQDKKCAGLPVKARHLFDFEHMKPGEVFSGKLVPKNIKGGVVLIDRPFTIK